MTERDLFAVPAPSAPRGDKITAEDIRQRRLARRRDRELPRGHAAIPGTGPEGETCGSCGHLVRRQFSRTYLKCGLMQRFWKGSAKTDVRAKDLACRRWAPKEQQP